MGFCIWRRDLWLVYLPLKTRWRSAGAICINCSVQFSSVIQFHSTLCNPMNCSTPGFPVRHQFPELTKTPLHWVNDAIQPSHLLSSPSPPTFNLSQYQGLFQWVSFLHQVAKVWEFQLQHQSFQWIFRTDFLQDGLVGSPCSPRDSQEFSLTLQIKSINSLAFLHTFPLSMPVVSKLCGPQIPWETSRTRSPSSQISN